MGGDYVFVISISENLCIFFYFSLNCNLYFPHVLQREAVITTEPRRVSSLFRRLLVLKLKAKWLSFALSNGPNCSRSLVSPPLRPSSDGDADGSSACGAVLASFPLAFQAPIFVTGWEGRRANGRQKTPVWWLQICAVLRVRSGRLVTSFGWDQQSRRSGL
jgi:hypothetical protein